MLRLGVVYRTMQACSPCQASRLCMYRSPHHDPSPQPSSSRSVIRVLHKPISRRGASFCGKIPRPRGILSSKQSRFLLGSCCTPAVIIWLFTLQHGNNNNTRYKRKTCQNERKWLTYARRPSALKLLALYPFTASHLSSVSMSLTLEAQVGNIVLPCRASVCDWFVGLAGLTKIFPYEVAP